MFQLTLIRERISTTPNQRVHALITIEDATQRRFPMPTPNHIPRAQPAKEATPATVPVHADHVGVSPSEVRA